jgi:hypothetical protein
MEYRHLRRGIQANGRAGRPDPPADVQIGLPNSEETLGVGRPVVGEADRGPWEAQLDLTAMPVPGERQGNSPGRRLGKDLRPVRQEQRRNGRIQS